MDWSDPSTTPDESGAPRRFIVTHPFHPLVGKEFKLVTHRHNWGEDRVYYHDGDGDLRSFPASWTDVFPRTPRKLRFEAAGRIWQQIKAASACFAEGREPARVDSLSIFEQDPGSGHTCGSVPILFAL